MDYEDKLREATSLLSNEINFTKELSMKYEFSQKTISDLQLSSKELESNVNELIAIRDELTSQCYKVCNKNFIFILKAKFKSKNLSIIREP